MLYISKGSSLFENFKENKDIKVFKDDLSEKLKKAYDNEKSHRRKTIFLEKISDPEKQKKWKDLDKQSKQSLLKRYMNENNISGKISDYAVSKVIYSCDTNKIKKATLRKLK